MAKIENGADGGHTPRGLADLSPVARGIAGIVAIVAPDLPVWAFAFRIWVAMSLALYASFWLQLESASSAAACVAILAQPRRGQALSKAYYRVLGTVFGGAASVLIVAAFGQDRVSLLCGAGVWLAICVFTAKYLPGTRAYGALLSGYTIGIVAISNIDSPASVPDAAVSRLAAVLVGIVAICLINDRLGSPKVLPALRSSLTGLVGRTRAAVPQLLSGHDAGLEMQLLSQVAAARIDVGAVVGETADGPERAAGARLVLRSVAAMTAATRTFANVAADMAAEESGKVRGQLLAALERQPTDFRIDADAVGTEPTKLLALRHSAAHVVDLDRLMSEGVASLNGETGRGTKGSIPFHRDLPDALQGTLQVLAVFAAAAFLFCMSGWPGASGALVQVATLVALSSAAPNSRTFAFGALFGMMIAVSAGGLSEFVLLNGGQDFPVLALVMLPSIFAACFLIMNPRTFVTGFIFLVYFPILIFPANPQAYNPEVFVDTSTEFMAAALFLFVAMLAFSPVPQKTRRERILHSMRADIVRTMNGMQRDPHGRAVLAGDRLAQLTMLGDDEDPEFRNSLSQGFSLRDVELAVARAHAGLRGIQETPGVAAELRAAHRALRSGDPVTMTSAAGVLAGRSAQHPLRSVLIGIVADLTVASQAIRSHRRLVDASLPSKGD